VVNGLLGVEVMLTGGLMLMVWVGIELAVVVTAAELAVVVGVELVMMVGIELVVVETELEVTEVVLGTGLVVIIGAELAVTAVVGTEPVAVEKGTSFVAEGVVLMLGTELGTVFVPFSSTLLFTTSDVWVLLF
jgi:hypothetical protein